MFTDEHIHHYTTIDTLALILKHQKIRFNRLDRVDDVSESQVVNGVQFGKYLFVSCWSHFHEESIPQWHMYTDMMSGVRISLPKQMFKMRPLEPTPKELWTKHGDEPLLSPIPFSQMFNEKYFVPPMFMDNSQFIGNVEYIDDVESEYKESVDLKIDKYGKAELKIKNLGRLARLKKKHWGFQNEFRFSIFILPSIPGSKEGIADLEYMGKFTDHLLNCLISGVGPDLDYFDVELDARVIDNIVVTLGPLISEGNRIAVETLVNKFSNNGRVIPSHLTGTIRTPSRK